MTKKKLCLGTREHNILICKYVIPHSISGFFFLFKRKKIDFSNGKYIGDTVTMK